MRDALKSVFFDTVAVAKEAELPLVASSLAYTTILSIIPVLAVSFSIFQAFGGLERLYESIEPFILENLAETSGTEAMSAIRKFISNARAGALGFSGLVALIFTTMSMLSSVERAVHRVWKIPNERSWFQRVTSYWFFITLGPIAFAGIAGYLTTAATGDAQLILQHLPGGTGLFFTIAVGMFCFYKFIPSCPVRTTPALTSALIASALWNLARAGYAIYTRKAVGYDRIYGGLSAVPILLLWIYIVWLITLGGAALTAALQNGRIARFRKSWFAIAAMLGAIGALTPARAAEQSNANWDYWYTITGPSGFHYGYYNDQIKAEGGRLRFQNHSFKSEEGYLNEESLGAIAKDDSSISPEFYNFRSVYRTTETKIDGSVQKDGKWLHIRTVRGGKELPVVKRYIPPGTFFSILFPAWIARRLPDWKENQSLSFQAFLEDSLDSEFTSTTGLAKKLASDDYAKLKKATRLQIRFRDRESIWWVDDRGAPYRIEMKSMNTRVERVERKVAEAFINSSPDER